MTNMLRTSHAVLTGILIAAVVAVGAGVFLSPATADAQTNTNDTYRVQNTQRTQGTQTWNMDTDGLFQLVILDRVLSDDRGNDSLTELVVLSSLFQDGNNNFLGSTGDTDGLYQLLILDRVLGDNGDNNNLAALLLLGDGFSSNNGAVGDNSLMNLIILDRVLDRR